MIALLMGVTGTGKTTVGRALAQATGWQFADADDFHSEANREKMHAGIPLTDEDRAPWLARLHAQLSAWSRDGIDAVLACSALKQSYRDTLTAGLPPGSVRLFYLTGPPDLIRQRLQARQGHYMPASMLPSQLAALEPPSDAVPIFIDQPVPEMVRKISEVLHLPGKAYAEGSEK